MPRHTKITKVSTRSPRSDWARPRSINDVIAGLERNGFMQAAGDNGVSVGVAFVRPAGPVTLRVTIAGGRATLETARRVDGQILRWRRYPEPLGSQPWQVAREALELLATLDVDTHVRWG